MSEAETLKWITKIVREELDDDSVNLAMDTLPADVEGWDSLAHVGIVMAIQKRVGAQFTVDQIEALGCVGDLVRLANQVHAA